MDNYFAHLNQINVSEHIEKKGNFSYLSWPFAVAQLRLADPTASWEVRRFEGLPYHTRSPALPDAYQKMSLQPSASKSPASGRYRPLTVYSCVTKPLFGVPYQT